MAAWGYVAIDKGGKEIKGSRDADNKELVLRDLKNQGLILAVSRPHVKWRYSAGSFPVLPEQALPL